MDGVRSPAPAMRRGPSPSILSTTAPPRCSSRSSTRRAAAWSAALEGTARTVQRRAPSPPLVLPTAPPAAAAAPGGPATPLSLTKLRRRATTATCPQAPAALVARRRHPLTVADDLDGFCVSPQGPTIDNGIGGD